MPTQKCSATQVISWLLSGLMFSGCAASKDSPSSSYDMAEYRKMIDEQKGIQSRLDEAVPSAPEMTTDEHEQAGDMEAQRRNFTIAGLHYDKTLKADPSRTPVRLKLGGIF